MKSVLLPSFGMLNIKQFWILAIVSACVLATLAYLPGLPGPFVFDDYVNIVQNVSLNLPDLSWHSLLDASFSVDAGPLMRPVSMLTFALNRYFFGVEPFSFKLVNLLIHLINGLLIFLLLRHLLIAFRKLYAPTLTQKSLDWLAALTGTLWLVHPLNLTAVLYVVQRETSLSSLFVLSGVNLYAWARLRQLDGRNTHWFLFPGTVLFGGLAMLSKESGALMPCYMLAVEACLFQFRFPDKRTQWTIAGYFAVFLLLPGLAALVWIFALGHPGILSYAWRDFTMGERLLTESRVVWLYIFWTLLPRISSLSLYHDDIPLSHDLLHPLTTLPACLGLLALVCVAFAVRRRWPLVTLGIVWFFAGQLLESTIFPLQIAFEHRNYLADLGILLAAMSLIFPLHRETALLKLRYTFCALLVISFAGVTLQRAWDWRNPLTLAESEAYYHPDSPYATYQLGQTYANLTIYGHPEMLAKTRAILQHSLSLPNAIVIAGTSLVLVESQVTHQISPGVLERIEELLRTQHIGPSDTTGLYSLVGCYTHKRCPLPAHSLDALFESAFANPYLHATPNTAADLHVIYGNYLAGSTPRRLMAARQEMLKAAALKPAEPQYRINVVIVDLAMENAALAEQDLHAVQQMNKFGLLDSAIASLEKNLARLKADQQHDKQ
ncbi:MAG TPA: hypothetical protein VFX47_02210 [Gammaproteobacteria bacterium]|nr:hypothetical protein [Gammaproteobacteria bacterium]